jgi:exosortase E/protease (VPEID-CTERM system)
MGTRERSRVPIFFDPVLPLPTATAGCSAPVQRPPLAVGLRVLFLALLFTAEVLVLSTVLDNSALEGRGGLPGVIGLWGPWLLRAVVAYAALVATFAYLQARTALRRISQDVAGTPVAWGLLGAHAILIALFAGLSALLYGSRAPVMDADFLSVIWLADGVAAIAAAAIAVVPLSAWILLVRSTGRLLAYALIAVVIACVAGNASRALWLWTPATRLTFFLSKSILNLFASGVTADPAAMTLGTRNFQVEIAPQCSGFEGAGLMLAFGTLYLWLFRRDCRFPHALALIPAGVITLFLLNSVRIAALVLIGDAGAAKIAVGGFHSQAGWIAFSAVALGFSVVARRSPWLTAGGAGATPADATRHMPGAAYLVPFLAILMAGMLSGAASAGFEWLYPLRFFAAGTALWVFRRQYSALDWNFSWPGVAAGIAVFCLWIALDRVTSVGAAAMPAALASAAPATRFAWIGLRMLAASVTVPIAEELAFRGFLMRRLASAEFDELPLRRVTLLALMVSSLAFGLLHGSRWMAGTAAGGLYGLVAIRKGRMGEAVIAHAVTNAMLAAYVVIFDRWQFW